MAAGGKISGKGPELLKLGSGQARPGLPLNLIVQGKKQAYSGPPDVRSLLEAQGENSAYVNIRINGQIMVRRDFENISLCEGDRVDFLYFMGGGNV